MSEQIAVRIPTSQLDDLDAAVASGRFASRAAAVRHALDALLRTEREREIAAEYARAYGAAPQEEWVGDAGLALMSAVVAADEPRDRGSRAR